MSQGRTCLVCTELLPRRVLGLVPQFFVAVEVKMRSPPASLSATPTAPQPLTETRFLSESPLPTAEPLPSSPSLASQQEPRAHLLQTAKTSWFSLLGRPVSSHLLLMKSKLRCPQPPGPPASLSSSAAPPPSCTHSHGRCRDTAHFHCGIAYKALCARACSTQLSRRHPTIEL